MMTCAVVGQHALELGDVAVGLAPLFLRGQVFDAFDEHPAIPAAIEDGDLAAVEAA